MKFIVEIERFDSFSPLKYNVKVTVSHRGTEIVIVMRRLFNYKRPAEESAQESLGISSVLSRN